MYPSACNPARLSSSIAPPVASVTSSADVSSASAADNSGSIKRLLAFLVIAPSPITDRRLKTMSTQMTSYHRTRELCKKHFGKFGVVTHQIPACDYDHMEAAINENTRLLI